MYDSIFPTLGNDINLAEIILVNYHFIFASLGNNIMKAYTVFVMYHSTFKRDETGIMVYFFNIDTMEILIF